MKKKRYRQEDKIGNPVPRNNRSSRCTPNPKRYISDYQILDFLDINAGTKLLYNLKPDWVEILGEGPYDYYDILFAIPELDETEINNEQIQSIILQIKHKGDDQMHCANVIFDNVILNMPPGQNIIYPRSY